jgi:NADH-quinone oxidoreductase subunit G
MPTLTIDNQTVTVPDGTNVLEAAKKLGIVIPHFCYHEALGAVGACRLCAMTFVEGPDKGPKLKGVHMSCMVTARDGMVVSTLDAEAVDLRKHVIEWLMMNHPHDCPVCDEGGECQLQDMTVAGGHGIRRFRGLKKTYNNQDLGPFVWHEMNRCIQCYRCVRTYQDYCGGTDFGVLGCNQRIYFGRFRDGPLESPFSGNIVDACPTGVFTDRTFRFRARPWDLEEAPSICPHCSLGCAVIPGARYRELQRVRGGVKKATNGFFICDRGRFGYGHANRPDRPRSPRLGEREVSWPEALAALRREMETIIAEHGPGSVAFLGSARASLESNVQLLELARSLGSDRIAFEINPGRERTARAAAALLGEYARSQDEIRQSDFILLVGADPLNEGPMMALAVRQALRQGGSAAIIDPRPIDLPFAAAHLPLPPDRLGEVLRALVSGTFDGFSARERAVLSGIAARLNEAKRPVLIGGGDLLGSSGVGELIEAAKALSRNERPCGAALLLAGPNSYGGALFAAEGPGPDRLMAQMQEGRVRALVCLESDPFADHPEPGRARMALSRLRLLAVLDYLPTEAARRSDIFLPTTAPAESAGSYVNFEGRMLPFATVFDPGRPIELTGGGDHPPRTFEPTTPGSLPRPAWAALAGLRGATLSLAGIRRGLEEADPRFAGLASLDPLGEGRRVNGQALPPGTRADSPSRHRPEEMLWLVVTESLFGSEAIASASPVLDPVRPAPHVWLHIEDGARLGIADGDLVRLRTDLGDMAANVRLSDAMAPGVVVAPRLRGSELDILVPGMLRDCLLAKEGAP